MRGRIFPQVPAQIQCENERPGIPQTARRAKKLATHARAKNHRCISSLSSCACHAGPTGLHTTSWRRSVWGAAPCADRIKTESMAGQQGWAGAHGSCRSSAPIIPIVAAPHAPPAASGRASTAAEGSNAAAARAHEHAAAAAAVGRTSHETASGCAMCAHARPPATAAIVNPQCAASLVPFFPSPIPVSLNQRKFRPGDF